MSYAQRDDPSTLVVRNNKRRGVALSCAECRRLKLKCSRDFPCSNCVKKGCAAICPEGSLTTGKGNRFVLANTEVLHDKISQLASRIRQLEDALGKSHSLNSPHPHPLLSDDLLRIKHPLERERADGTAQKEEKTDAPESIDALGSLSISDGGRGSFYGQTANSWYLLQIEEGSDEEDDQSYPFEQVLSSDMSWLNHAFPLTVSVGKTPEAMTLRGSIVSFLPKDFEARQLCNTYFRHAAWMYAPISELEFYTTIYNPVYDGDIESVGAHSLAVLCMVLAIGVLLDLQRPFQSPEAHQYYRLGRIALALESVLDEQTVIGIQALLLMCHFMFISDMGGPRWVTMGIVVKLAQSVNRDSGKWKLNAEETQKRRDLFFEVLTYDSWQSLTFGRPPSLSTAHIDTKLPHESYKNAAGEEEMTFAAWKHRFSYQCLSQVHDQAFGAKTPSYRTIQELDRKVRADYVPPSLQVPGFGGAKSGIELDQPSVELTMQRYTAFAIKEMTLFYMHRGFFAQALEDSPSDPMGSKYAQSVLAAYGSACTFIGLVESLFKQHPTLTERMWFLFTHVFSCAIVLGSIATKPQMALAPSALSHLESAYNLFFQVSDQGRKAKILPILRRLKDRARSALSHQGVIPGDKTSFSDAKNEKDELSVLGGMTRLVSRRSPSSPSSPYTASSPGSQPASPTPTTMSVMPFGTIPTTQTWPVYSQPPQFNTLPTYGYVEQAQGPFAYSSNLPPNMPQSTDGNMQDVYNFTQESLYNYPIAHSPEGATPPQDPIESWQNFMAQFQITGSS
ncbi:hypothetical protein BDN72DRAFT_758817 [Pluteus cervinus]|uniref:Uncharacterized protein n=1 Tax=Pluteus cervinus TaxID=181527 RepID=A0ACD3BA25_9AGAR|nr:hypothetical protein BDN72DRAFT_758817 [Pluteus cervinus]